MLYVSSPFYRYEGEMEGEDYGENYVKRSFIVRNLHQILLWSTNEEEIAEKFNVKTHCSDVVVDGRVISEELRK